eukprot:827352-Rhodomonas_salina.2
MPSLSAGHGVAGALIASAISSRTLLPLRSPGTRVAPYARSVPHFAQPVRRQITPYAMAVPHFVRREIAPALSGSSHLGLLPGSTICYVGTDSAHTVRNQTQETTVYGCHVLNQIRLSRPQPTTLQVLKSDT